MAKVLWISSYSRISHLDRLAVYAALALPAMKAAGGRVLARGLPLQTYEQGQAERVVVIQFDSVVSAHKMHDDADYQAAFAALAGGAERDIRIIETV